MNFFYENEYDTQFLNTMLTKILRKIMLKSKAVELPIIQDQSGRYIFKHKELMIYSNELQCIKGVFKKIFEDEVYHFNTDKQAPLIVDVGANIGLGILYWKRLYPDARIIAFEPSIEVFKCLKMNVDNNNLSNVELHQKAVSDFEGNATFTANEKISGSLILQKNLAQTYQVEVVSLSQYLKNKKVDFLKIDIEGAERQVFFEILPYLKNVDNLFIEYHSFIHENQYLAEILKNLQDLNFRYYIEDDFKVKRPLTSNYRSLNQDMKLNIWAKKKN